jgi:CBS domain-containing protein
MTPHPVTVGSTSTVQDAADMMVAADVRHLPVVAHGTLIGMISDRDLRSYMLPRPEKVLHADEARARMAASVSAVMRTDVITVHPDMPVAALLDIR